MGETGSLLPYGVNTNTYSVLQCHKYSCRSSDIGLHELAPVGIYDYGCNNVPSNCDLVTEAS